MISNDYKKYILSLHTHKQDGSEYWRSFFLKNNISVKSAIENPESIPPMDTNALRTLPLTAFIPKKIMSKSVHLIMGETSGFSGKPITTVFTEKEFHAGFIQPFLDEAEKISFPLLGQWLWAGPSGPHIIGKAIRGILRSINGLDPFAIDFDPRWFRKMPSGSFSQQRYFNHIKDQIFNILNYQNIEVIFSTPPVIQMLAEQLCEHKRNSIRGVHYGGLAISYAQYQKFRKAFPNAVHLSGYGNSLFGVFIENSFDKDGISYCTDSERVEVQIVRQNNGVIEQCDIGEKGRVMMSRFDESFLILNMLERDSAVKIQKGIKNPGPLNKFKPVKVLY